MQKFRSYPQEAIVHLTNHVQKDRRSLEWLIRSGYRELVAAFDAIRDDKKAFRYLLKSGHPELAAFVNSIWDDETALHYLLDNKCFEWAACANLINGDEKAEEFLKRTGKAVFVNLAHAIQARIHEDADRNTTPVGILRSIFNFRKIFGKDEDH